MKIKRLNTVTGQYRPKDITREETIFSVAYPTAHNERQAARIHVDSVSGESLCVTLSREEIEALYIGINS